MLREQERQEHAQGKLARQHRAEALAAEMARGAIGLEKEKTMRERYRYRQFQGRLRSERLGKQGGSYRGLPEEAALGESLSP